MSTNLTVRARAFKALPAPPMRRAIRVAAGLSQRDLAEALGRTRPAVTRWESGERTPRGGDLVAYVALLQELAE
jgi:transcriptional regulator with XRE-family HTH domain